MSLITRNVALGVAALLVGAGQADAAVDPVFEKLARAKTIRCTVGRGAVADYKNWGAVELANWGKRNTMHFDLINLKKQRARLIGNLGGVNVAAYITAKGLHFVEQTKTGNVHFMTVYAQIVQKSLYKFVISRHISLVGKAIPSQYYGMCVVLD